ncbi:MAG: DUF4493 domain-containing protein [Parabacteroides sp.]|nr:DUF4493 domain-containing protein [Parabacteroides sp.]
MKTSQDLAAITKAEMEKLSVNVAVCKAATGGTVKFFESYDADKESGKIQLAVGKYYVKAGTLHKDKAAFDQPFYFGVDTIDVVKSTIRESEVVCTLANVKVTVNYSDMLKKFFTGYKATIGNASGELTFEEDEKRAGYFAPGKLNVTLNLVNNDGTAYKIVKEIPDAKAREHYRLIFSIGEEPESPEAGGDFDITVNEETNDIECTLNVPVFTDDYGRNVPKIGIEPQKSLSIKETNPKEETLVANVSSKVGLQLLALKLSSHYFNVEKGLPEYIDLVHIDPGVKSTMENIGIAFPAVIENKQDVEINFSRLLNALPLLENKKTKHSIIVLARDLLGQQVEDTIMVEVRPNVAVMVEANPWSRFAFLTITAGSKENIRVTYSGGGSEQTIEVDPGLAFVNADGDYQVECLIPDLSKNTSYTYTVIADVELPVPGSFKTTDEPLVPNLDFEEWNGIYPNKEGKGCFWATGNEEVKTVADPNTTQVDDCQNGTKAVRMISLGGIAMVNTAAGNLFVGSFDTDIFNPANSPSFGKPYTGRPTKLTGYYKYDPADATYGSYTDEEDKGMTKDIAEIYIWLKDSSGKQIGYGRFNEKKKVEEYAKFEIDIKYTDKVSVPATMTIVATSSKYGGVFSGTKVIGKMGIGSVLFVDNFSLSFEYNEKSFK